MSYFTIIAVTTYFPAIFYSGGVAVDSGVLDPCSSTPSSGLSLILAGDSVF